MAISASSSTISYLNSQHSCNFISSKATSSITPCSISKCSSSLSSLPVQFPLKLRRQLRIGNNIGSRTLQRSRSLPLVEAKKQTFSSFDEMLTNSDKPVLVDFYATWCGPCQFMVPILEQVNEALKDKVQLAKIDTEKYPQLADKYKIEALPTFILFKDGEPCDRFFSFTLFSPTGEGLSNVDGIRSGNLKNLIEVQAEYYN